MEIDDHELGKIKLAVHKIDEKREMVSQDIKFKQSQIKLLNEQIEGLNQEDEKWVKLKEKNIVTMTKMQEEIEKCQKDPIERIKDLDELKKYAKKLKDELDSMQNAKQETVSVKQKGIFSGLFGSKEKIVSNNPPVERLQPKAHQKITTEVIEDDSFKPIIKKQGCDDEDKNKKDSKEEIKTFENKNNKEIIKEESGKEENFEENNKVIKEEINKAVNEKNKTDKKESFFQKIQKKSEQKKNSQAINTEKENSKKEIIKENEKTIEKKPFKKEKEVSNSLLTLERDFIDAEQEHIDEPGTSDFKKPTKKG
ncbi:MAG: hypothetical protein WC781_05430 [Candidatus Pacearchaeota archaeon]|jgi:hypothetical protein